jgi:D-beta-D-heptose 7-phosphate kinase / D-beta-D-heptose 1-phosphate adenosyltransferase
MNLPPFNSGHLLVVGDVMLDRYWHGNTSRISPEAPVPVVQVQSEERRVGGAGNVAVNASVLGAQTTLIGLTGNDSVANDLQQLLESHGVNAQLQRVGGSKTITKLRVISRHQQLIRLDFEDHFPHWNPETLKEIFTHNLQAANAVILSDYAKGALRHADQLIAQARKAGKPVVVDPKGSDFARYRGATVITPNLSEFEAVVGVCDSDQQIADRARNLCESLDLNAILVTRSEKGMTLVQRDKPVVHLPTRAQEVYDVTGAGDTVVATLGAALAAGSDLLDAVTLSNVAAGVVVAKLGTATVSREELQAALGSGPQASKGSESGDVGVLTQAELMNRVNQAKAAGQTVVMTNGCFDILHPGHVDYLQKARALGDRLVVAVNSDHSVAKLKGPSRPVNHLAHRMTMLAALSCVDWVVPFSEDTPEALIAQVLPNILVKGGDYTVDQVAGGQQVIQAGGRVQILPFLAGHSTTGLIEKIQAAET